MYRRKSWKLILKVIVQGRYIIHENIGGRLLINKHRKLLHQINNKKKRTFLLGYKK
jgi:hypothetical protein